MSKSNLLKELGENWKQTELDYIEAREELQQHIERVIELKKKRKEINKKIVTELEKKFPEYRHRYDPRDWGRYKETPKIVKVKYRIEKAHDQLILV